MKHLFICASLLAAFAPELRAHEGHSHEAAIEAAPHGGNLRDAGDFKGEIVVTGNQLKLYLYDKALKPVKVEKSELKGEVQFPKEKAKPVTFKKKGEFYEAEVKGLSKVHRYDLHITLEHAGKKTLFDFGLDNI